LKQSVAEVVTEEFFRRHPDWLLRYGERGRQKGIEDAIYHIDFLSSAIEIGSGAPFQDYARWTCGVLHSRGIAPAFIAENLLQLREALVPHLSDAEGVMLTEFIRVGCEAIESDAAKPKDEQRGELALSRSLFLQTLLQGQRKAAATVALEALTSGHAILDVYAEVLQESLYSVGRLWEANEITVAQEHTATAIVQYVLALLYEKLRPAETRRGKVVITGVEGELHQVGANMVADALETDGWDVRFLGTNMPHEGIVKAVQEHEADVVGISATMLFNLPKVRRLVTEVRQRSSEKVRVVVGGGAFYSAPNLPAEIGADGSAPGLREAIVLLSGLSQY
jgi:methylmalonyl-CoA mutase cobalamin-binding domain/chain